MKRLTLIINDIFLICWRLKFSELRTFLNLFKQYLAKLAESFITFYPDILRLHMSYDKNILNRFIKVIHLILSLHFYKAAWNIEMENIWDSFYSSDISSGSIFWLTMIPLLFLCSASRYWDLTMCQHYSRTGWY